MIRVLIVEDDPMVAEIDKKYVEDVPQLTVVGICNNGKDALEVLKKNKVDLIILDVYMPKLNGIELLKELRKININSDVIMVTAADETKSLNEILNLGVIDYLIKPFEYQRFLGALNKFLEKYTLINTNYKFKQSDIDILIANKGKDNSGNIKKGLNEKTLDMIRECIKANNNKLYTSEEIAEKVGLSRVTIRRYMNYMMEIKEINSEIDYQTGGRPSIKYKCYI
ncbi:response regulator [Clostridium gasigenes]|uniref:Transcriptional regulatory protein n=1 Tax=Clostridium gasigenes TaxID=94869 RepID=A0A7X0S8Z3_9CLOT|nr:response regulator [Clostridium gasigenes]MBB6713187.1 response regulator [Clostridium gasigenes]